MTAFNKKSPKYFLHTNFKDAVPIAATQWPAWGVVEVTRLGTGSHLYWMLMRPVSMADSLL